MTPRTIDAGVLRVAYEEHGPADGWPCLLGHGFPYDVHAYAEVAPDPRRGRSAGDRPLPARLRADPVPRLRRAALGRAGRARRRPPRAHGRARDRARGARRLRLGRAGGLRRLGAVAGARRRARLRQFLQHPEHRSRDGAGDAGGGGGALVPVLFPQRARPDRPDEGPARDRAPPVAAYGRRPGHSTRRPSNARRRPSTRPTSSMW